MFGGSGKGGFVRTRISSTERMLSWLVLALIATTGLSVYLSGQTYDESLFGLDPASLSSVSPERAPANTIVVPSFSSWAAASRAAPEAGPAAALTSLSLPGWRALGSVEQFTPATLYEKINGRAEAYISYDVVGLSYYGLATDDGSQYLDIYVYDMGTPERAFGIYSVERDPSATAIELGRRAYVSGASFFVWHGNYYVQVLASDTGDALRAQVRQATDDLLAELPDTGSAVAGLASLPTQDMVPGSEKYYARNALGFGFLTRTYSADYRLGETDVTLFLSVQEDAAGAQAVWDGYLAYLTDFEAQITQTDGASGSQAAFGDLDGYYDVIHRQGNRVAGAALLEDRQLAERIARDLLPIMSN